MMRVGILSIVLTIILMVRNAQACAVCFGDPNSLLTKGMGFGIWTLMAFIFGVLALFSVFFFNIRTRIKKNTTVCS